MAQQSVKDRILQNLENFPLKIALPESFINRAEIKTGEDTFIFWFLPNELLKNDIVKIFSWLKDQPEQLPSLKLSKLAQ